MPPHACLLLPELLGRIFIRIKPTFPYDTKLITQVMSVCRLWHNAALSTPDLWTTLEIYNFDEWHKNATLHQWLNRSKNAFLYVESFIIPNTALVDLFIAHM